MMLQFRVVGVAAFTGLMLLVAGSAKATVVTDSKVFGGVGGWSEVMGDNTLEPAGGDKIFTYLSDNGNFTDPIVVTASWNDFATPGDLSDDTYSLGLGGPAMNTLGPGTFTLFYCIQITDPNMYFDTVELDSDHEVDTVEFTKQVFSDALMTNSVYSQTSLNGVPIGAISILGSLLQKIWVLDTLEISATGEVSAISNGFTQSPAAVPEPSSLVLLGLGGLGMVYRLRRRAK